MLGGDPTTVIVYVTGVPCDVIGGELLLPLAPPPQESSDHRSKNESPNGSAGVQPRFPTAIHTKVPKNASHNPQSQGPDLDPGGPRCAAAAGAVTVMSTAAAVESLNGPTVLGEREHVPLKSGAPLQLRAIVRLYVVPTGATLRL